MALWKRPGFRLAAVGLAVLAAVLALFLTEKFGGSPAETNYQTEMVLYSAPYYSLCYTPDTAPQYRIVDGGRLFERRPLGDGNWHEAGELAEVSYTEEELEDMFLIPNEETQKELSRVKRIYRADAGEECRLVMELEGEKYLVMIGYEDENGDVQAGHLFRVTET